ncbi:DUF2335 domain-containing protein [Pseudomonas aeruginosa]|uniref:DUF2335 domain-containing protein n=1 Tax=Pseudomonas aeruginosa TaxID=287 RepID=UPI0019176F55|nr:DUF2335 domain-containing protein [Pseudomonas aeruginosa]EKW4642235.1 DUF2335 domain-containing protein [Pseudomonas aeruginosa]MBH4232789.1 DUF2335 domain-containing protein [Pseudomonas aeruginosa]MCP9251878.1 DUF2335 domain-containing protein [Pseudomonas aeruginosa]MDG3922779.1 DUF2335 domain-containing protein [Pseudomonas aeruginosa]MDG4011334.1 DUF2335 domain-containing protein [Pseudomonas aeruginosa]
MVEGAQPIPDGAPFDSAEKLARIQAQEREEERELECEAAQALDALEHEGSPVLGELLEKPTTKAALSRVVASAITLHQERHSGPLPSPRQMREYEKCLPGAAERIMAMAEREQQNRHETQRAFMDFRNRTLEHVRERDSRGQWLGFALALGVLALGTLIAVLGFPKTGAALAAGTMIGLAGVFISRRVQRGPDMSEAPDPDESDGNEGPEK